MPASTRDNPQKGRPVYIVDGSRSPFLKARSGPGPFKAADLAVAAARPLLLRQPFEPEAIDEVITGCITPAPDEVNIARLIALRLGLGHRVPAWTVQRNCASGMQAVDSAWRNIRHGYADLVLAGGVESMSHAPVLFGEKMVRWLALWQGARSFKQRAAALGKFRPALLAPVIGLLKGLTDPTVGLSMGQTAENLATRFGISREEMDVYAVESHKRLARAQESGFLEEIEAIYDVEGKCYENDDGVRADSSVEALAKLKPVFDRNFGNITAGNSAQITDGTAWLVLASETALKKYKLPVVAEIVDSQWAALSPAEMGLGPVHAVVPMLARHRLGPDKIDYWELNEAFAAQVLACVRAFRDPEYCKQEFGLRKAFGEVPHERLNIDGGGISLGHPVGASGARIVLHLARVLARQKARRGVATICIGGGQGGAMLIENAAG
ncbi:MAG: acetyl-CoA C-acetyltransferase [Methylococcaceae bacterium]|nr:acetyl-CoA C-acetyltransferase [Methylococcaceae bacterium]MCI0732744.1 acetyl-CoA C-acetyltransferase [Methylococcaceae bacterium]